MIHNKLAGFNAPISGRAASIGSTVNLRSAEKEMSDGIRCAKDAPSLSSFTITVGDRLSFSVNVQRTFNKCSRYNIVIIVHFSVSDYCTFLQTRVFSARNYVTQLTTRK